MHRGCSRLIGISGRWGWARHLPVGWPDWGPWSTGKKWTKRCPTPAHAPTPDLTFIVGIIWLITDVILWFFLCAEEAEAEGNPSSHSWSAKQCEVYQAFKKLCSCGESLTKGNFTFLYISLREQNATKVPNLTFHLSHLPLNPSTTIYCPIGESQTALYINGYTKFRYKNHTYVWKKQFSLAFFMWNRQNQETDKTRLNCPLEHIRITLWMP